MRKLAISFITYNRAKHIKEDLDYIAQATKNYDIDIYIYDGSTNVHTECIVKKYIEKGNDHIHYFRSDSTMSSKESAIQRLNDALLIPEAEYIWLCGDKFVIKPEYYSDILSYINQSYDIITIYGRILKGTKEYNSPSDFAEYAIVPITQFGTTIIKKKLIEQFSVRRERERLPSFGVQLTYLKAIITSENFKGAVIDTGNKSANIVSRYQTKSGSLSCMWDVWVLNWYQFINSLPDTYNDIRERLFSRPDQQMAFFSAKELLRQRSEGQFNWKKYLAYRKYVKQVIVMPNIFVFGISILPRSAAKCIYNDN